MNPKKNIPHPEAERGKANALLLFILAFIAASFTLLAGTTSRYQSGIQTDKSCTGFGSIQSRKDAAGGIICERPYMAKSICSPCTSGDQGCSGCLDECVPSKRMQAGTYVAPSVTLTNTTKVNSGGKLEAAYEKIISAAVNKDGSTTYTYTVTGKGEPQCVFQPN